MLIVGMLDGKSCAFRQALGGLTDTDSEWHPLIKCCHGDNFPFGVLLWSNRYYSLLGLSRHHNH